MLCSCFAGALALSSCGGGGGGEGRNVAELLRPFVNGNFSVVFSGDNVVAVTGTGQYALAVNSPLVLEVHGVVVECRSETSTDSVSGQVNYKIVLDDKGVPQTMEMYFSGVQAANDDEATELIPVREGVRAEMVPGDTSAPFQVGTTGTAEFNGGEGVPYRIVRAG